MTESEAKGFIQGKLDCMNKRDVFVCKYSDECDSCQYCYSQGTFREQKEAFQIAINALEEVERYRNIGVISSYEMEQDLLLYKADREILNGYQELGTVEELKLVKEKQIAKKPEPINYKKYMDSVKNANFLRGAYWCPGCKHVIRSGDYCDDCGQKIDWSDEE